MRSRALAALAVAASLAGSLAGCGLFTRPPPPPPSHPRFVVGDPYRAGGVWQYPRTQFAYDETGLAAVDEGAHDPLTSDGEAFDQTILAASHRTLQLPAIARVTNLDSGLSLLLRVNDRGPQAPSRLISLTSRAATLLGAKDGSRVRVEVQEGPSRALAAALGGDGPKLALSAVPAAAVTSESLAPPPGTVASARGRQAPAAIAPHPAANDAAASDAPLRLPEDVTQGPMMDGRIYVDAGSFGRAEYARLLQARIAGLGAQVVTSYAAPRDRAFTVRIGPLAGVAAADAMLDRAIAAGVTDARIVVTP